MNELLNHRLDNYLGHDRIRNETFLVSKVMHLNLAANLRGLL